MFGCYHCHVQMDELQDLVAHSKTEHADVSAHFSFRYFVKTIPINSFEISSISYSRRLPHLFTEWQINFKTM